MLGDDPMSLAFLVQRWDEARLVWEAKGYSIDEVIVEVQAQIAAGKRPELANLELSESTVARLTRSNRSVPKGFGPFVEGLSTKKGRERETEIVEAGLRVLRGHPPRSKDEPKKIAQALLAIFPTNDLALKLADALLAQAQVANGSGSLLDVFAHAIAGRVPYIDPARLARIISKRIARSTLSFGRLVVVAGVASVVACGAWFLLDKTRSHSRPAYAPVVPVMVYMAGSAPIVFDLQALLGAAEMGEKPLDQPIPPGPLPGQKVPPCDAVIGEEVMGGGCWTNIGTVKPPCGRLFRSGDSCYRPIAADPKKPVGSNSEVPH